MCKTHNYTRSCNLHRTLQTICSAGHIARASHKLWITLATFTCTMHIALKHHCLSWSTEHCVTAESLLRVTFAGTYRHPPSAAAALWDFFPIMLPPQCNLSDTPTNQNETRLEFSSVSSTRLKADSRKSGSHSGTVVIKMQKPHYRSCSLQLDLHYPWLANHILIQGMHTWARFTLPV